MPCCKCRPLLQSIQMPVNSFLCSKFCGGSSLLAMAPSHHPSVAQIFEQDTKPSDGVCTGYVPYLRTIPQ